MGRYFVIKSIDEENIHKVFLIITTNSQLNIKSGAVQ
jgi:hypothetical protein